LKPPASKDPIVFVGLKNHPFGDAVMQDFAGPSTVSSRDIKSTAWEKIRLPHGIRGICVMSSSQLTFIFFNMVETG